ncbi:hypothetical protein [Bradyrhizobium ganzhouense]|uniref:hypothetical protein n=1 Tax=Bradyrhizobium ganzhouense TaxID=1179767 RepID=UPI003CE67B6A
MIRVQKPNAAPQRLDAGVALVAALEHALALDPAAGASSKTAFKFDKSVYGHTDVKNALKAAQHDKCCYCEARVSHIAAGHVEHYRPKTCSQQAKGESLLYPGYYWLAYAWPNLYFVCERCNSSGKKNLFPLRITNHRNRRRTDDHVEEPLILDPGGPTDPRRHIKFNGPAIVATSRIGKTTVASLGLNRIPLKTARLSHLKLCTTIRDFVRIPSASFNQAVQQEQELARQQLARLATSEAEYSAMVGDFLASP